MSIYWPEYLAGLEPAFICGETVIKYNVILTTRTRRNYWLNQSPNSAFEHVRPNFPLGKGGWNPAGEHIFLI